MLELKVGETVGEVVDILGISLGISLGLSVIVGASEGGAMFTKMECKHYDLEKRMEMCQRSFFRMTTHQLVMKIYLVSH